MPQGFQAWDALGNLTIDTNYSVLRDFVVQTVSNVNTAVNAIPISAPANATIVTNANLTTSVNVDDRPPETNYDAVNGEIEYKWGVSGNNRAAKIRAMAY